MNAARIFRFAALPLLMTLLASSSVEAVVSMDGTMGAGGALSGPNYAIGSDLGQLRGKNLFHSFQEFNLVKTESATFSGPDTVSNIIGRVTGPGVSSIDGLIRSTIPGANLFLLNPSGMIFGPNAQLNVSGSFHASTADYLRLADGGVFYANPTLHPNSVLTSAAPSAFGFLGENPSGITIDGGLLQVPYGKTISLVGGDIDITRWAYLYAPGGRINIASVASPGEVVPDAPGELPSLGVDSFARLGNITLDGGSQLSTRGQGGGSVFIRGGRFVMESKESDFSDFTSITARTDGNVDGAPIGVDIAITNDFLLLGGEIISPSYGAGKSGDIRIKAGTLQVGGGVHEVSIYTGIGSDAYQGGKVGNVEVTADRIVVKDAAGIFTAAHGYQTSGTGGDVKINTGSLEILDGGYVFAFTVGSANAGNMTVTANDILVSGKSPEGWLPVLGGSTYYSGNAGKTTLTTGSLRIKDGGAISTSTSSAGKAGDIDVVANSIEMTNHGVIKAETLGTGSAGNVSIKTGSLDIMDASWITTSGFYGAGKGNGGNIDVTADRVLISGLVGTARPFDIDATSIFSGVKDGAGGNISLTADSLSMTNRGTITSSSYGMGTAGNITLKAGSIELLNGAGVMSATYGPAPGGMVDVTAGTVVVSGVYPETVTDITGRILLTPSNISSQSVLKGGKAGSIRIAAERIEVLDGARISTETFGMGSGGNISLEGNDIRVSGVNADLLGFLLSGGRDPRLAGASISSSTHGGSGPSGPGGNLQIAARNVELTAGGRISSETDSSGAGGNVTISTDLLALSSGGSISARSTGSGNAGSIAIASADSVLMRNGFITAEALQADGGNITLKVGSIVHLVDSEITASVGGGPESVGGNIFIDPQFVILKNSQIVANAFEGTGGRILISANVFLADPQSVVDASSEKGVSGTVDIQAVISNVTGLLGPLPSDTLSASALLRERCIARIREGKYSSFVVGGRDGLPIEPGNLMPSPPL